MKVSKIILLSAAQEAQARALSRLYSVPFIDGSELASAKSRVIERFVLSQVEDRQGQVSYCFLYSDEGLALAQVEAQNILRIRADFCSPTVNYRRHKGGGRGQMIAKAVGLNSSQSPCVLDATAGLGGDAFVLASLGCRMTLVERVPEVRSLLSDGLHVAQIWGRENDVSLLEILERMQVVDAEAIHYMDSLEAASQPDVVYLDPMFPARSKTAQVKKAMHVFHDLVGFDPDADNLLVHARECARKRVVVKRPRVAPPLAQAKPSYSLEGKSNRFDIYVTG